MTKRQAHYPQPAGTGEKDEREELIEENDHQDSTQHRLGHLGDAGRSSVVPGKKKYTEVESQGSQGELSQYGGGKRDPLPAESQAWLDLQLPDVDVLLKLAGKKFARLRIQPGYVRREGEDAEQESDDECGNKVHGFPPTPLRTAAAALHQARRQSKLLA